MTANEKTKPEAEPKKTAPIVAKFEGPNFIPGVPARDLTEEDLKEIDEHTMERLRQDAERETPIFKHKTPLGHSELWKAEREREKTEKAAKADSEKGS